MYSIALPRSIYAEIIAHAREGKPEEICGILRGQACEAFELVRGRNVAPDRVNDYVLDPQTLLLQFEFEDDGDEMVAIYHSHPVSVAYPSASDAWNAHYPDSVYLICSLEHDNAPVMRAFRLLPHYPELDLDALRKALDFYETRPGLYGYFLGDQQPLPAVLRALAGEVQAPFYVVYQAKNGSTQVDECRIVSVEECTIQIV